MKKEVIKIIKILGNSYNELIFDIDLNFIVINTIELNGDDIILHHFPTDDLDFDIEINFDDIGEELQSIIFTSLSRIIYN